MNDLTWLVERNIHGAWVVCGACGIKQYYYYTKTDAKRKYKEDADVFYNITEKRCCHNKLQIQRQHG